MDAILRLCLSLAKGWKRLKLSIADLARLLGEALEFYQRALATAYVTAHTEGERNGRLPDDDLQGRDPGW